MDINTRKVIDVYPYLLTESGIKFLLLQRNASKVYAGQWRMIGGKIMENEKAWEAALRELKEETQMNPRTFWTVPTVNQFYEPQSDSIYVIPVFAAELDPNANIVLDSEHDAFGFFSLNELKALQLWPEHYRIIGLIESLLAESNIKSEWQISLK
jgi:dATP pyrophosphohydrolase